MPIKFEGLVPHNSEGFIPDGYAGLHWDNVGAADKAEFNRDPDGYKAVVHQRGVAFNWAGDPAGFSSDNTFSLKNGHFAAAWNIGLDVVVRAYSDGVLVGEKHLVLDQVDTPVRFGRDFRHIDQVTIESSGGTDGTGNGGGTQVAFDNLKINFDFPSGPVHVDAATSHAIEELGPSHAGTGLHAADWLL
jgi:hypothetical protein